MGCVGVGTLGSGAGVVVDFWVVVGEERFWTSWLKILLRCWMAWSCGSPGDWNGASAGTLERASAKAWAACVVLSFGEDWGAGQLCGKKATVLVMHSAQDFGTYALWQQ